MSVCVRWYALTTPPLHTVKRLKIFSGNPIFFNSNGEAAVNRWVYLLAKEIIMKACMLCMLTLKMILTDLQLIFRFYHTQETGPGKFQTSKHILN